GRRDEEAVESIGLHARADVARRAAVDSRGIHRACRRDDCGPQILLDGSTERHRKRSGNMVASAARSALATPRSVMRPVTSRAGVTSNAKLTACVPAAPIDIVAVWP